MCNSVKSHLVIYLVFILAYFTTGCGAVQLPSAPIANGDVYGLFQGTAEYIKDACLAGDCFTTIFSNGKVIVYSMPFMDGYAFTGEKVGEWSTQLCGGNFVNCATWLAFKQWMLDNGYLMSVIRSAPSNLINMPIMIMPAMAISGDMGIDALGIGIYSDAP